MCEKILDDTGVVILPGSDFGRPEEEFTTRMAYVDFEGKKSLESVRQIPAGKVPREEFLNKYCKKVLMAADRICSWISDLDRN